MIFFKFQNTKNKLQIMLYSETLVSDKD